MVDIIIPVFKGFDITKECISRILKEKQKTPFNLILINDATPETEIRTYLEALDDPRVTLFSNKNNLGFVKSVNIGLRLNPGNDVILLNSDALVSGDWLDRIIFHLSHAGIASVTPFSNNATICSFPEITFTPDDIASSPAAPFTTWDNLDECIKFANNQAHSEVPTGVGFCMALSRQALDKCGLFNEELFGMGYGEEVEWCLRASKKGFKHLLAEDIFVAHVGSVSFGKEARETGSEKGSATINKLYPEWPGILQKFLNSAPALTGRGRAQLLAALSSPFPRILHICHNQGGGVEYHIKDIAKALSENSHWVLFTDSTGFTLGHIGHTFYIHFKKSDSALTELIESISPALIHVHNTSHLLKDELTVLKTTNIEKTITLHDYYFICPQINLMNQNDEFCSLPEPETCNKCIKLKVPNSKVESIEQWRIENLSLLLTATKIIAPSESVKDYYLEIFPELRNKLDVVPHPDQLESIPNRPPLARNPATEKLKILLLGTFDIKKGLNQVVEFLENSLSDSIEIIHFGDRITRLQHNPKYRFQGQEPSLETISEFIDSNEVNLSWLPGICPETYSYVLSKHLRLGLPIVANNIGAFKDRLSIQNNAKLLSQSLPIDTLIQEFNGMIDLHPQRAPQELGHSHFWQKSTPKSEEKFSQRLTSFDRITSIGEFVASRAQGKKSMLEFTQRLWWSLKSNPVLGRYTALVPRKVLMKFKALLK